MRERFKIYCENDYWAKVGEEIYYDENDNIYKLFKKNTDIVFAYIPKDVYWEDIGSIERYEKLDHNFITEVMKK